MIPQWVKVWRGKKKAKNCLGFGSLKTCYINCVHFRLHVSYLRLLMWKRVCILVLVWEEQRFNGFSSYLGPGPAFGSGSTLHDCFYLRTAPSECSQSDSVFHVIFSGMHPLILPIIQSKEKCVVLMSRDKFCRNILLGKIIVVVKFLSDNLQLWDGCDRVYCCDSYLACPGKLPMGSTASALSLKERVFKK